MRHNIQRKPNWKLVETQEISANRMASGNNSLDIEKQWLLGGNSV